MRLASVHEGDLVLANIRGRRFLAHVDGEPCAGAVPVTPVSADTYRSLTARQVIAHYPRRGGTADQLRYVIGGARRRVVARERSAATQAGRGLVS